MKRRRLVYWISDKPDDRMRRRGQQLYERGYDVTFFDALDPLLLAIGKKRAAIIIVGDEGPRNVVAHILQTITNMPEIQGARLVFATSGKSPRLRQLTACANFRDMIPHDIDDSTWIQRFQFATAGKPLAYTQPTGQITLNNISKVALPARITWINESHMRIECRARPPVGANLNLSGDLAEQLGIAHVRLTVEETRRDHLVYRFSDAIIARWNLPSGFALRKQKILEEIGKSSPGTRCRVFIAVQSSTLRSELISRFDDPRFEVSAALSKQAIVAEPKFFTPDVVIIERSLVDENEGKRFYDMTCNVKDSVPILVVGKPKGGESSHDVRDEFPQRRIIVTPQIPRNLVQQVLQKYVPGQVDRSKAAANGAYPVTSDNPISIAEVNFSARLTRIHPQAARLQTAFPVSNFSLCRIESPILSKTFGRYPYLKVTAAFTDGHPDAVSFPHVIEGYLADLDRHERSTLAKALSQVMASQLSGDDDIGHNTDLRARTPELGVIRHGDSTSRSQGLSETAEPIQQITAPSSAAATDVFDSIAAQGASTPGSQSSKVDYGGNDSVAASASSTASYSSDSGTQKGSAAIWDNDAAIYSLTGKAPPKDRNRSSEQRGISDRNFESNAARDLATTTQNLEDFLPPPRSKEPVRVLVREESSTLSSNPPRRHSDSGRPVRQRYRQSISQAASSLLPQRLAKRREEIKRRRNKETFQFYAKAIFLMVFFGAVLYGIISVVAPNWKSSGEIYTEQLKKFAPKGKPPPKPFKRGE